MAAPAVVSLAADENFLLEVHRKGYVAHERRRMVVVSLHEEAIAVRRHLDVFRADLAHALDVEAPGYGGTNRVAGGVLAVELLVYAVQHSGHLHVIEVHRRQANEGKREQADEDGENEETDGGHPGLPRIKSSCRRQALRHYATVPVIEPVHRSFSAIARVRATLCLK